MGNDPEMPCKLVIDATRNHYLLIEICWQNSRLIYGTLIHLNIINQKIWIQEDGTEEGVADELVNLGIPHQQIVLAFKTIERRKITDFALY
nr:XisI protein [Okeania sp. SIO3I5]